MQVKWIALTIGRRSAAPTAPLESTANAQVQLVVNGGSACVAAPSDQYVVLRLDVNVGVPSGPDVVQWQFGLCGHQGYDPPSGVLDDDDYPGLTAFPVGAKS